MSNSPEQARRSGAIRTPDPVKSPMLSFDLAGEIEHLRREDAWQGGRNSKTLVKHLDFRVVLTVLKARARLREHRAAGSISVQTVAGHIGMHPESKVDDLPAGHLLALEREIAHAIEALEDSAFLLTIAWPESASSS
jgi:quercetin dioxygenase-like cupin family protein